MAEKKKNGKDSNTPKYIKGFPLTGNKPPAYSFDIYDKAVQRDSTQLSSFFGSLTARPGIENVLQINREYRDKAAQILQQNTPTEYRGGGKRKKSVASKYYKSLLNDMGHTSPNLKNNRNNSVMNKYYKNLLNDMGENGPIQSLENGGVIQHD